ncbi:MAG TPA: polysaccharide deacetylase family protein [Gaiellaceae bacterium]|jgi:peptidoglycan/xylan/chitin deacetylase (PgdA/CDA1 family)|nr:polysaccharide deacetylase family protein [Gaiellaceae bacterium]
MAGLRTVSLVIALVGVLAMPAAGALRLPAPVPNRTIDLPVLMYHRVGPILASQPAVTQTLTVSPANFAAQMTWLHAHGYHAITPRQAFEALEYGRPLPAKPVMITFDDGYRDILWHAAAVLHRLHMPATAYIITGRVSGPDPSFLTWPELVRLEKFGFTIGSHTVTHRDLRLMSSTEAYRELRDSRLALQQHLGRPVQWLAYPFGAENASVVALALKAGYVLALTTQGGVTQSGAQPLLLHRYEVTDSTGVSGLAGIVGG